METQDRTINGIIVHILNFAALEIMRTSFALAATSEPWVVKGLSPPDYMFEVDDLNIGCVDLAMELLSLVEDKNVIGLLKDMKTVMAANEHFRTINGLLFFDVLLDDEIYNSAAEIYYEDDSEKSYEEIVVYDCEMKYFLFLNIWRCTELLATHSLVMDEAQEEDVFVLNFYEYIIGGIKSEDENIQLLLTLMADLG